MVRLLHTSDWHLGATFEKLPRQEEHDRFLDWLCATIDEEFVDLLVIAGDVFDHMQPSAAAQRAYYRFLARVTKRPGLHVVVVGGNHDSESRLDAARELLEAFNVHVVGGIPPDSARRDELIVPIRDAGDDVRAVVLAVPFVPTFRLGVKMTGAGPTEMRASFEAAFRELYSDLTERATSRFPGVPIVATGHLACDAKSEIERDDAPCEIHMVGTLGALNPTIFDDRIDYVALGHIHRAYPAMGDRVRYSGSPIPITLREMSPARKVVRVDLERSALQTKTLAIPLSRELRSIHGTRDQIVSALEAFESSAPLAAYVQVDVEVERFEADLERELRDHVSAQLADRFRLVGVRQHTTKAEVPTARRLPRLRDLGPAQVFERLCGARGKELTPELLGGFAEAQERASSEGSA